MSLILNYLPVDNYSDEREAECEECGQFIEEDQLRQCQLGFCGAYVCPSCIQVCSTCFVVYENAPENLFIFCRRCANKVMPRCCSCRKRFCQQCADFKKCLDCSNTYCTGCLLKDNQGLLETNKCNQCSKNKMKSLEDLCKSVVRMSIATKGADMHSKSQGPSPTAYINQMVAKLNLPIIIKESLLIQD